MVFKCEGGMMLLAGDGISFNKFGMYTIPAKCFNCRPEPVIGLDRVFVVTADENKKCLNDKEAQEIFNALINYSYNQVMSRMVAYGESFELALANYIK